MPREVFLLINRFVCDVLKRKPNQKKAVKNGSNRDTSEPKAVFLKERVDEITRPVGVQTEENRKHNPKIKKPGYVRSKDMRFHVTDPQSAMHG